MLKRLISAMLVLVLCLGQLTTVSFAANDAPSYTSLSDFTYILDTGAHTVTLTKYIGASSAVTVSGSYTVDGASYATALDSFSVFIGNSTITSVKLCQGTRLANNTAAYLFGMCSGLTSVDLSGLNTSGVTSLRCMFAYCSALETLDLTGLDTSCVTDMTGLFSDCIKLSSLSGYENWDTSLVESIYMAFNKTSSLKTVDLSRWSLSRVTNSGWCFQLCNADQILLPDDLKTISAGFLNHAKQYSGTSFAVPAGVERIGYAHTFYDFGTGNFAEFTVAAGNSNYVATDGVLYSADGKELLAVPRSKTFSGGVFEIPEGVTFLGELCFSRNYNITTLVLPDSLNIYYVGLNDPNYVVKDDDGNLNAGSNLNIAIYRYTGITSYAVKATNPKYACADGIIYSKDMTTVVAVPSRYDRHIAIPQGVTAWGRDALWAINTDTDTELMASCPGVSIPSTLVDISQDQLDMLNRLNAALPAFTITVDPQNSVYCVDDAGNLTIRSTPPVTEPEETQPAPTEPADTTPTEPVSTEPAPTQPVVTVPPVTTEPTETQPPPTTPAATDPAPTEPVDTSPAETVPSETFPSPTVPEETVPPQSQPPETSPEQTQPTGTAPPETDPDTTKVPSSHSDPPGSIFWYLSAAGAVLLAAGAGVAALIYKKKHPNEKNV